MNTSETVILEHLNRRLAERGRANLESDSELLASGVLDSLSLIELISFCEKELGVVVPDEALLPEHFESPRTFALLIDRLRN
jgi:acyl carrier protein